jgi:alpha-acetolactate decarboxylase
VSGPFAAAMRASAAALLLVALAACRSSEPGLKSWGSMREVMREGKTHGRVGLAEVLDSPGIVGIGALEGLRGEIAIVDGTAWVARLEPQLACARGARPDDRATLLAISDVDAWSEIELASATSQTEFELLLEQLGRRGDLAECGAWPFVVEGELLAVETHVLNGQCPFAGAVDAEHEPIRRSFAAVRAKLIGFYAPDSGGELVHHGQVTHAHLLVETPEVYVGHVDSVAFAAGARLRIPARP